MGVKCAIVSGVTGFILLVVGILSTTLFNVVIKQAMKQLMPLVPGSFTYDKWQKMPIPIYMQFWVFDVINVQEVYMFGAKPYLVEKGPYTYRLQKEKTNITQNANSTVTYIQPTWYYFDRNMSVGNETDNFTTINNVLLGAAYLTRFEFPLIKDVIHMALDTFGGKLYETYSVRDVIWGYEDPLLKIIKYDVFGSLNLSYTIDDVFGICNGWNGTTDGLYNVYTGKEDITRINIVDRIDGLRDSPYWSTPEARMINGTDGSFFPPFVEQGKSLYMYSTQFCRTVKMDYVRRNTVQDVDTYQYNFPLNFLDSGVVNPDNAGFCTPDLTHCMPSGILNVTNCRNGSSATLGYPHFLHGDPVLLKAVDGLHPDPSQHTSYLDVEPLSGLSMDIAMKLQVGVYVTNFSHVEQLKDVKPYNHPIFWFNETTTITDDLVNQLKSTLLLLQNIVEVVQYVMPCVGAIVLALVVWYFVRRHKRKRNIGDTEDKVVRTNHDDTLNVQQNGNVRENEDDQETDEDLETSPTESQPLIS